MKSVSGWIRLLGLAAATLPAIFSNTLRAQDWPQRPVKLILPLGAGSGADTSARFISEKLQKYLGKAVVIEPRPGGDSVVAINAVLNAGDNHTFFFGPASIFVMHPHRYAKLSYDFQRDFVPLAQVAATTVGFTVPASLPVKSLKEFIDYTRANPGKVSVTVAPGTSSMMLEAFVKEQNIELALVPYRDVVQAGQDLSENRIQILASSYAVVLPHAQAGKVRILSTGAAKRTSLAPDLPSPNEAGFPELAIETTVGFYGPAGMPRDLRIQISKDILGTLGDKEFVDRLTATGQVVNGQGPDELAAALKEQAAAAKRLADILGIKPKE